MTVQIERGLNVIVPQTLAHGLNVDARLEQEGGMRVSEAMESDRRHRGETADPPNESPTDDGRVFRRAARPTKDKVQIGTIGCGREAGLS